MHYKYYKYELLNNQSIHDMHYTVDYKYLRLKQ